MGWETQAPPIRTYQAVYYIVLPEDNKVLHSYEIGEYSTPNEHLGDWGSFRNTYPDCPLIPVDTHHALLLAWVDLPTMTRNRPYLDETIKAAIALVA